MIKKNRKEVCHNEVDCETMKEEYFLENMKKQKKNNLAAIKHKKVSMGIRYIDETKLIRGQINRSLFKIELREHIKATLHQTTKKRNDQK